ncbi:MAG TPA: glycosyltransferase [Flavobacterium sp.]|jgi:glycosyltransferase involved in cell wall biosynthesis
MEKIKSNDKQKSFNNLNTSSGSSERESYDMVVFCHLRWEFVYQRPQHIISRMSKEMKILLIEEPIHHNEEDRNTGELVVVHDNLHILKPRTTSIKEIKNILPQYISSKNIQIGWFYSPSFVSLLPFFDFDTTVYDCMDELTLFKGAPIELLEQEKYLIANADIIFTGGKSLYESKKKLHKNVYCFPSSVDQEHFAKALNGVAIPEDIAGIPAPIVGYFGVIDERLDLDLLDQTAQMNPEVSFVMIGPLAKISDEDLPRQKNIHFLGMKSYTELPSYLKAFSVAMMPFALNDATKFISPTKTLEYIAAGKPIISTAIKDVVRDYDHCVSIVSTADEFSEAINTILQKPLNLSLSKDYKEILERTSWDNTASKMSLLISKTAAI